MSHFKSYLAIQYKRTMRSFFVILAFSLALLIAAFSVAIVLLSGNSNNTKISVGIVGDGDDKLLNMGFSLLEQADTSRYTIEFVHLKNEGQAIKKLNSKEIGAYILIPEGFASSLTWGGNKKVDYVMANRGVAMGPLLTKEVVSVIENYIVETQRGVTAVCWRAENLGFPKSEVRKIDYDMSFKYVDLVTKRESLINIKEVGLSNSLSMPAYYICGFIVFFLLIWGVACCTLRVQTDCSLKKMLCARGTSAFSQIIAEYLPYLTVAAVTLLIPFVFVGIASSRVEFPVTELKYFLPSGYYKLIFKLLPVVFVITSMQFALYELVYGTVNAVLMQLFVASVLGYIGGCFYPINFFPDAVRVFSSLLPTGVAFSVVSAAIRSESNPGAAFACLLYGAFFMLVSLLVRRARINSSGVQ